MSRLSRRGRREDGLAALELAIVMTLLTTLIAGVIPLALIYLKRVELGRDAGDLARFATARAAVDRAIPGQVDPETGQDYVISEDGLPLPNAVLAEIRRVTGLPYQFDGSSTPGCQSDDPATQHCLHLIPNVVDDACPGGSRFKVILTTTVNTGPFGNLLGSSTKTLSAQADSCRE